MKIENVYITKMAMEYDRFKFNLETNGYMSESLADTSTKCRIEISSPVSSELSEVLIDKMRNREHINIEVN